jgi:co-chaperonin GroES (HSP10)
MPKTTYEIKIKARPTENRVFLALRNPPNRTKGGLILPDAMKDRRAQIADVLEVGPGRWVVHENGQAVRVPMDIKPGDVVICGTYAGAAFDAPELPDKVDFRIVPDDQILMVLEDYKG